MKIATALLAAFLLAPAAANAAPPSNRAVAHIGQTVRLHGLPVTPLRVLEDSRCPQTVTCVWAGRIRLAVRVGGAMREVTLRQPVPVPGGQLQLAMVAPARMTIGHRIAPRAYRFGFEFIADGGLQLISREAPPLAGSSATLRR